MSFFYGLGKSIIPQKIKKGMKEYIQKTGKANVPYSTYGMLFSATLIFSIVIYIIFIFPNMNTNNIVALSLGTFLFLSLAAFGLIGVLILGLWIYYEFTIFKRTTKIEEVLPDFLQEVSVNLRAGMSFDKSLWNSVKPEYEVLNKEIEIVAKKVMIGKDTEQALKEFAEKYKSTLLQESMDMIIIGLRSGGNISDLIDKIVENVKDAYYLRRELIASVTGYVIFITTIAVVISPTLFALSFNLMEIIQGLGEKLTVSASYGVLPLSLGYQTINPQDFIMFSKIAVIIISSISSMIIAELREGSIKAGIKYLIAFIPISYFIYISMLTLFTGMFGILI